MTDPATRTAEPVAAQPTASLMAPAWLAASAVCVGALALTESFREMPAVLVALLSTWLILRD